MDLMGMAWDSQSISEADTDVEEGLEGTFMSFFLSLVGIWQANHNIKDLDIAQS